MARTPIQERSPIARWLIGARGSLGLTAEDFLRALAESGAKAPHRSNYAGWESGRVTPEDSSLRPIVAFYAERGVDGPEPTPPTPEPVPDLASALLALARSNDAMAQELAALRAEREAWERGVLSALAATEGRAREALLASLVPQPLEVARP